MKTLVKCLIVFGLLSSVSCRDTKKEEAEAAAMVEEVEAVEAEVDVITEDINSKEKALEEALKELDSL